MSTLCVLSARNKYFSSAPGGPREPKSQPFNSEYNNIGLIKGFFEKNIFKSS